MRTVGGGESAQPAVTITSLASFLTIEVEDANGDLQDLTEFAVSVEYDSTTDEIVDAATIVFRRYSGVNSLAPLMTANPPLDVGRDVVITINPGDGTIDKEVFRGRIDKVDWPQRFGDVKVECRDQAGVIADTWIESEEVYGSDAGVALETVMQSIATDHLASAPTIYVPVATSAVVSPAYTQSQEGVLSAMRTLAESIGWVIRWRYIDSLTAWRWTLFEPSRSKTDPDHTFGVDDYYDVTVMGQEITDIRNVVEVEYTDENGARQSVTVSDATSIAAYGRRYMKISEAGDSPVNNSTLASSLANAALSDLKDPDALLEITAPYFWPGEVGVDLYRFTANDIHFSADQDLAAMSFRHRIAVGERPETKILCRGKPSGGVLMWRRKAKRTTTAPTEPESVYALNDVRFADESTGRRYYWSNGLKIEEIWTATSTVTGDVADSDWEALKSAVALEATDIEEKLFLWPAAGQRRIARIEGRWYDAAGNSSQDRAFVIKVDIPSYVVQQPRVNYSVSWSGADATVMATLSDPTKAVTTGRWFTIVQGVAGSSSDVWDTETGTPGTDATLTFVETVTVNPGTDVSFDAEFDFTDEEGNTKTIGFDIPLANLQAVAKTLRIPATKFVPGADTFGWTMIPNYFAASNTSGLFGYAALELPDGVTITGISARMNRGSVSDTAEVKLFRNDEAGNVTLATLTHSTTGYQTVSSGALTEDTTGRNYTVRADLNLNTLGNTALVGWVEVTYTADSFAQTI